jgi:formylmethanofuran dehydrogenase subunit E
MCNLILLCLIGRNNMSHSDLGKSAKILCIQQVQQLAHARREDKTAKILTPKTLKKLFTNISQSPTHLEHKAYHQILTLNFQKWHQQLLDPCDFQ